MTKQRNRSISSQLATVWQRNLIVIVPVLVSFAFAAIYMPRHEAEMSRAVKATTAQEQSGLNQPKESTTLPLTEVSPAPAANSTAPNTNTPTNSSTPAAPSPAANTSSSSPIAVPPSRTTQAPIDLPLPIRIKCQPAVPILSEPLQILGTDTESLMCPL